MNDLRKDIENIIATYTGEEPGPLFTDAILDIIIHELPEVYGEDGIQNYNDGYTAAIVKVVEILTAAKEGK